VIIITGLGRCGTSLLAKFFHEMEFNLGNQISWNEDMRAGYEFAPAYAINRDLYTDFIDPGKDIDLDERIDCPYWGYASYRERIFRFDKDDIPERHQGGKIEVIKDPRFTWSPLLIRSWRKVRSDLKLIICHRNTQEIWMSRKYLGEKYYDPKHERMLNPDIYKIDFNDFLTEVMRLDIPFELLFFPNFLTNLEKVLTACKRLDISIDKVKARFVWGNMIDLSLVAKWRGNES